MSDQTYTPIPDLHYRIEWQLKYNNHLNTLIARGDTATALEQLIDWMCHASLLNEDAVAQECAAVFNVHLTERLIDV